MQTAVVISIIYFSSCKLLKIIATLVAVAKCTCVETVVMVLKTSFRLR